MVINFEEGTLKQDAAFGDLEFLRHVGQEPPDNRIALAADHAIVRAGEAAVAKEGGAARKNLFIGSLNMGMSADDGADATVEHAGEGNFFRSGLGMKVDENEFSG